MCHDFSSQPIFLTLWRNSEIVNPTTVAVVAAENASDDFAVIHTNEYLGLSCSSYECNIVVGRIPWTRYSACVPKCDNVLDVSVLNRAYFHVLLFLNG